MPRPTAGHAPRLSATRREGERVTPLELFLLGLVGFRYRHVHTINRQRLGLAIVLLILTPVTTAVPAIVTVAIAVVLIWAMIAYEHHGYDERREQLRREASVSHSAPSEA